MGGQDVSRGPKRKEGCHGLAGAAAGRRPAPLNGPRRERSVAVLGERSENPACGHRSRGAGWLASGRDDPAARLPPIRRPPIGPAARRGPEPALHRNRQPTITSTWGTADPVLALAARLWSEHRRQLARVAGRPVLYAIGSRPSGRLLPANRFRSLAAPSPWFHLGQGAIGSRPCEVPQRDVAGDDAAGSGCMAASGGASR
jgi:hypothetical protein